MPLRSPRTTSSTRDLARRPRRSSSPAPPADSAGRSRSRARRAAPPSCCTAASCASSKRSTTRSSRRASASRRSCRSISRRRRRVGLRQRRERAAMRSSAASTGSCTRRRCWARSGPLEHQSFDSWLQLLRVNVAAPMALTRVVAAAARPRRRMRASCSRSTAAARSRARTGAATRRRRRRLRALAHELADEWEHRPNLRVNAVVPGPDALAAARPDASRRGPLRRCRRPKRWCRSICICSAGQSKADSGALIDAQAWLAVSRPRPARRHRRLRRRSAAARAAAGNRRRGSMSGSSRIARDATSRPSGRQTMRRQPRADVASRRDRARRRRAVARRRPVIRQIAAQLQRTPDAAARAAQRDDGTRSIAQTQTASIATAAWRPARAAATRRAPQVAERERGDRSAAPTRDGAEHDAQTRRRLQSHGALTPRRRRVSAIGRTAERHAQLGALLRGLLAREQQPRRDDRVGIERDALDPLRDQPLREIRMVRRPLPADADVLAAPCGTPRSPSPASPSPPRRARRTSPRSRRRNRDRRRASAASCRWSRSRSRRSARGTGRPAARSTGSRTS